MVVCLYNWLFHFSDKREMWKLSWSFIFHIKERCSQRKINGTSWGNTLTRKISLWVRFLFVCCFGQIGEITSLAREHNFYLSIHKRSYFKCELQSSLKRTMHVKDIVKYWPVKLSPFTVTVVHFLHTPVSCVNRCASLVVVRHRYMYIKRNKPE